MTTQQKKRRVKKRWLAGFGGACLTALTVIEAGSPLCPALDAVAGRSAGDVCRAVTLSAGGVRRVLSPGPGTSDGSDGQTSGSASPGGDGDAR